LSGVYPEHLEFALYPELEPQHGHQFEGQCWVPAIADHQAAIVTLDVAWFYSDATNGAETFQWQHASFDDPHTFTDISGASHMSYALSFDFAMSNEGLYRVQVSNEGTNAWNSVYPGQYEFYTAPIRVAMLKPPSLTSILANVGGKEDIVLSEPYKVYADQGKSVTLHANIDGVPVPESSWSREDSMASPFLLTEECLPLPPSISCLKLDIDEMSATPNSLSQYGTYGDYFLHSTNSEGSFIQPVQLIPETLFWVLEPSDAIDVVEGTTVFLSGTLLTGHVVEYAWFDPTGNLVSTGKSDPLLMEVIVSHSIEATLDANVHGMWRVGVTILDKAGLKTDVQIVSEVYVSVVAESLYEQDLYDGLYDDLVLYDEIEIDESTTREPTSQSTMQYGVLGIPKSNITAKEGGTNVAAFMALGVFCVLVPAAGWAAVQYWKARKARRTAQARTHPDNSDD
jgi:hypothetical protein